MSIIIQNSPQPIWRVVVSASVDEEIDIGHYTTEDVANKAAKFVKKVLFPSLPENLKASVRQGYFLHGYDEACVLNYDVNGEYDPENASKRVYGVQALDAKEHGRLLDSVLPDIQKLAKRYESVKKKQGTLLSCQCVLGRLKENGPQISMGYYQSKKVSKAAIEILQNLYPSPARFEMQEEERSVSILSSGEWAGVEKDGSTYKVLANLNPEEVQRFMQFSSM